MSEVVETVKGGVVEPILAEHSFYLYDIEFVKEQKSWYLRIYIDKPGGGITIDDCVLVSDEVSEKLDEMDPDPIPQAYYLDVSSPPGAERTLRNEKDLNDVLGSYIHVSLYQNLEGQKVFEGDLTEVNSDTLVLDNVAGRKTVIEIPRDQIAKARLAIKF
ncbi:ribosome maturation factor RimP [Lentilactobacillus senioris]|uniref:ribosome maturation factor RimP n=1 Tax=Lentilactobacillus senioris TaxID=931534 RepID=UPI0006D2782E|nr:ribosome maturation factor RimP [Lentilactobacillus senioris]